MRSLSIMMIVAAGIAGAADVAPAAPAATAGGKAVLPAAATPEASQGMVVTGDQEAPLVLYILPWQPPRLGSLPEVDAPPLLPKVLDSERSVLDDPLNRPEPAAFRLPR